ncbi:magnesium chelatase accessory protein [Ectothiorhodospira magna]|uniref:Magnesium chelatase accessory protein n=1 Tax=Ectothiorhodospira magna TaxID=867345 RepID=A0A1H8ZVG7_9GAMM|nr:magnesium chelatase accessory protein [Ectothiorhodospira magna]
MALTHRLDWNQEGHDWPHRHASRFIQAGGLRWHVQCMGEGPPILLVHGTGSASHSWRDLMPRLARHFTVIVPDLPGHGFSSPPARFSGFGLPGMATALAALLRQMGYAPALVAGHSAGAAVLARMCLDGHIAPRALVSINGVMLPLPTTVNILFSASARFLSMIPFVSHYVAWRAMDPHALEILLQGTGSQVDQRGMDLYGRLVRNPGHLDGTLNMMVNWDLHPLGRDLARLSTPLVQVIGSNDRTVLPSELRRVKTVLPQARLVTLPGLGHLAHEERPDLVEALLLEQFSPCS